MLVNQIINIIESFIGIYFIDRLSDKNYKYRYTYIILFTSLSYLLVTLYDIYYIDNNIFLIIDILVYYTFASLTRKNSYSVNIFNAFMVWVILTFSNSLAIFISKIVYYDNYPGITIETAIVSKIIYFISAYYISKTIKKYQHHASKTLWYINIVLACLIIIHVELFDIIFETVSLSPNIIFGLLIIMILSIVVFCIFNEYSKYQREKHFLESELQHQKDNYQNIVDNDKKIKKIKHDLNHILLSTIYCIENNNSQEALNYLKEKLNETNLKNVYDINNKEFNFILNYYKDKIDKHGIELIVTNQMEITPFDTIDFFIVIGNLLDNAIENINPDYKKIIIHIYQDQQYTTIIIKNTYDSNSILKEGAVTSKKDKQNHGIGLKSIKGIIRQYNGILIIDHDDLFYKCMIKVPVKTVSKNKRALKL
ncbi:MAG: GHKL domain-containing protein [Thomasclavelia sp.]|uniref:GHKL domain-containing protein n=1 Tax=Thomasclavelia sp. TaxID=3025757 RepID=UPI00399F40F7